MRKGTNRLLDHPRFSMQQCKCVDIHRSAERMPSGPRRVQQEALPTGPTKGATEGKLKESRLAEIELYDKKKGQLTSVQTDELLTATVL